MERAFLSLDSKGILPAEDESQMEYRLRGYRTLFSSGYFSEKDYDEKSILGEIEKLCSYKATGRIPQEIIKQVAQEISDAFDYDVGWIKGYYFEQKPKIWNKNGQLTESVLFGSCIDCYNPREVIIPYTVLINSLMLHERSLEYTLAHELVHVPRSVFCTHGDSHNYEEAFAYSPSEGKLPSQALQARQRLKEAFGEKWGYVLGRLTIGEIDRINYLKQNPAQLVKDNAKKSLRHQIMAYNLGL